LYFKIIHLSNFGKAFIGLCMCWLPLVVFCLFFLSYMCFTFFTYELLFVQLMMVILWKSQVLGLWNNGFGFYERC
jgi:hypothetical protein